MTSTELKIGMTNSARPSSRVLKPPGGGHTNIFGEPDVAVNAPRPKYNQQNSSNLNACMGSTDANHAVEKLRDEVVVPKQAAENASATAGAGGRPAAKQANNNNNGGGNTNNGTNGGGGRVPPGGYSSGGFW